MLFREDAAEDTLAGLECELPGVVRLGGVLCKTEVSDSAVTGASTIVVAGVSTLELTVDAGLGGA